MEWKEIYVAIYRATCDRCGHAGQGWFWIKGTHDRGTLCIDCYHRQG
jgi:hypothetical protein